MTSGLPPRRGRRIEIEESRSCPAVSTTTRRKLLTASRNSSVSRRPLSTLTCAPDWRPAVRTAVAVRLVPQRRPRQKVSGGEVGGIDLVEISDGPGGRRPLAR